MIHLEKWLLYGCFSFFSTFAVYNGQRLIKSAETKRTPWLDWVRRNTRILYALVCGALIGTTLSLMSIGHLTFSSLVMIGIVGVVSVFYVVKIKGINMREIAHLKIHIIALAWALALILFPALNEGVELTEQLIWTVMAHYVYIIGVTIPFDIRDLKFDRIHQQTIPQVIGVKAAKVVSILMLFAFMSTMIWQYPNLQTNPFFYLAVSVQLILSFFMNEKRGDLYCAGAIDGAIALLGISYFW